ncbi:hemagglutinin repeat-containing protein, partial [Martelella alba]
MIAGPVAAHGIVADGGAMPGQQAEVIATHNGLPQVNISAPNQAGVSHNAYQQFDIGSRGAILNNSALMTSTQLAGMIQGNPNLHPDAAPARVILNEINSNNPSQLRGFLEVAGSSAHVIIANPAGIVCNGCGTINAGQMTLSTGKPRLNADGSLAGYQVERGVVRVEGSGLNNNGRGDTPYVDILARAVEINAGIWANEKLSIVAGVNHISADGQTITPQNAGDDTPEVAIDMGQMGGMYSGSIRMIGTEAGVGVRNQGGYIHVGKTLTVSSAGRLSWQVHEPEAVTKAGGNITLAARNGIEHGGKLHSGGAISIHSCEGAIKQSSTLVASGDIHLNATGQVDISQSTLSAVHTLVTSKKGGVALRQAKIDSGQLTIHTKDKVDARQSQVWAGRWEIHADSLFNQHAVWSQVNDGECRFALTGVLDNTGGIIEARQQDITAGALMNQRGSVLGIGGAAQHWRISGKVDNDGGKLSANGDLWVDAGSLNNRSGILTSRSSLYVNANADVHNAEGKLRAGKQLVINAGGVIDNQSGLLYGEQLQLSSVHLGNAQGQITSQGDLNMQSTGMLENSKGRIFSGSTQTLQAQSIANRRGEMKSLGAWTAVSDLFDNREGSVQSQRDMTLTSAGLDNDQGLFQSNANQRLHVAQTINNAAGKIMAKGRLDASGAAQESSTGEINNVGGQWLAGEALNIAGFSLDNTRNGLLRSNDALQIRLTGRLDNRQGKLQSGKTLTLDTRSLQNAGGTIASQHYLALSVSTLLDNNAGAIRGNNDMAITADRIVNAQGEFNGRGGLTLTTGELHNNQGRLIGQRDSVYRIKAINNQNGMIKSGESLTINAHSLDNQGGTLEGGRALALTLPHDYTHRADSTLMSNGAVSLSVAGVLTNLTEWELPASLAITSAQLINQGQIVSKILQLTTGQLLNQGRIDADSMLLHIDTLDNPATITGDDIEAHGRNIDNHGRDAVIAASRSLRLQSGERLTNRDGALLNSGGDLNLDSKGLIENNASVIEAAGEVKVAAGRLHNLREGLLIERAAEKNEYKWRRYNYYWRSYGSGINYDKNTMTPTVQRLSFRDDAEARHNRYGTLLNIDATGKRAQVRVKTARGPLVDLWVNYLALKPNADGSHDMTFYETRGHRQDNAPTPYHNTVWREYNRGRIEQWTPEKHIDIAQAPWVDDYSNFRERTVTGTVARDILVSEGTGPRIQAGGNMTMRVTGHLLNDAGTITANDNLDINGGGRVENKSYSINERRQEYIVDHYDKDTVHWYPTFNRDESTELAIIKGNIESSGKTAITGLSIRNNTVNQAQISSTEAALHALDAERAEWERNPLAFGIEGIGQKDDDSQRATGRFSNHSPDYPFLPAELPLTQKQHLSRVATTIPDNGLFRQHTASDSPFLVVTDPRFTSRSQFISSDYLLSRVGFSPAQTLKRLGDGFYEQRLVREQWLKLTGRSSARGENALAAYQQLMNNGVRVAADFHLVPGVALTPEQIAALTQDIVWLVSETVETVNGPQTVWVPKVYLSHARLRLTGDGAVIAGGELHLSAESINNAGTLCADQALTLDAKHVLHQGGDIKADAIDIQAESLTLSTNLQDALRQAAMSARDINLSGTDIRLRGAKIDAMNTLGLNATNNLEITTAKSSHTASLDVLAGAMGDRSAGRRTLFAAGRSSLNEGDIHAGGRLATIQGEWQQALGSQLSAGGRLNIKAGQDIKVQGSQAQAGAQLNIQAGGDVKLLTQTTTNTTQLTANSRTSLVSNRREEERLLPSMLSGAQDVFLAAGKTLLAEGAQVDSTRGRLTLSAENILLREARQQVIDEDNEQIRLNNTESRRDMSTSRDEAMGSTFSGRGGVAVIARKGNIAMTGSTLHSEQGAIALQSAQDVKLNSATERQSQFSETHSNKTGVASKSASHTIKDDKVTHEIGSLLSGRSISVTAGNDLVLTGSAIAADQTVDLQAGRDVVIAAATETESHYLLEEHKKSGLSGSGGIGFSVGSQSTRHQVDENGVTHSQSVSTVGSSQGSVNIQAGNQLHIDGADLVAGKDLNLTGDSVRIDAGYDKWTREETFETKQSGLTLALSGTVGSAVNAAVTTAQRARKESDSRLSALQNTKAALSGIQAVQAYHYDNALTEAADAKNAAAGLKAGDQGAESGATNTVGVTLSYGSQSSKSETRSQSTQARSGILTAGQNLSITATGKNHARHSGDIIITGNQLKAGNDLSLNASRDINLLSAHSTEQTEGKNSSKGGSIGVGIGVGSGGAGLSVSASVNKGKGYHKGHSLTHTDTTLDAGNRLTLTSGRDTTLKGAQASGDRITADIGRHLTLQSERNSDHYEAKQQNMSAGGSFTFGTMSGSASVNVSRDTIKSDYNSVAEQTGFFARGSGYDIKVEGHTQLDGAVIASQAGVAKNTLDTGTLGWSDIHNQADYQVKHQSAGFNSGGPVGGNILSNLSALPISGVNKSDHAHGTTKAAVSAGKLMIRDKNQQRQDVAELSRDTDHANGSINPIFDQEQAHRRLQQAQLIIDLGAQA